MFLLVFVFWCKDRGSFFIVQIDIVYYVINKNYHSFSLILYPIVLIASS